MWLDFFSDSVRRARGAGGLGAGVGAEVEVEVDGGGGEVEVEVEVVERGAGGAAAVEGGCWVLDMVREVVRLWIDWDGWPRAGLFGWAMASR